MSKPVDTRVEISRDMREFLELGDPDELGLFTPGKRLAKLLGTSVPISGYRLKKALKSHFVKLEEEEEEKPIITSVPVSKKMLKFLGKEDGDKASRIEVTMTIARYIRDHNLQSPDDRGQFIPDETLRKLLGTSDIITRNNLQRYIMPHFVNWEEKNKEDEEEEEDEEDEDEEEEEDEEEDEEDEDEEEEEDDTTLPPNPVRPPATIGGFMRPVPVSKNMLKFLGKEEGELMSRVSITSSICRYVKEHNLQNPDDRRQFTPDQKLRRLLGTSDTITYYNLQKCLQPHFFRPPCAGDYLTCLCVDCMIKKADEEATEDFINSWTNLRYMENGWWPNKKSTASLD